MGRGEALGALLRVRDALTARGVAHAGVFGSVAREAAGGASDVDVIVTPKPGARWTLFELGGLQDLLDSAFEGKVVDLVVEPVADLALRDAVARDRINAF